MLGSLSVSSYAISFALYQPVVGTPLGALLSYITAVTLITLPVVFGLRKLNAWKQTAPLQRLESKETLLAQPSSIGDLNETPVVELESLEEENLQDGQKI
jgi:hypothetical protein